MSSSCLGLSGAVSRSTYREPDVSGTYVEEKSGRVAQTPHCTPHPRAVLKLRIHARRSTASVPAWKSRTGYIVKPRPQSRRRNTIPSIRPQTTNTRIFSLRFAHRFAGGHARYDTHAGSSSNIELCFAGDVEIAVALSISGGAGNGRLIRAWKYSGRGRA
jgi:hypothetical protein